MLIGGIGAQEILLIFLAILILFGAKKIPEIAQGLGKGIREFKKAARETKEEFEKTEDTNRPENKNG
ncbi:MAG: twin-arginine translocase TatA/TatE family subunit [candidate division Zixibacteria bacterium]|jgi:sec-independent protein translocase protein TatA|nr:twin-arginine translocase TatA/TatE family subunit [candidate division Zixibacteria bacterium]